MPFTLQWGHLDLPLSVLSVQKFYFCDKGGKVGASMTCGHISNFYEDSL